jgi:hypothetical protein
MLKKPIELHIYDEENQKVKDTYKLCILPWGATKKIISAMASLDEKATEQEIVDKFDPVICDIFQNKFDAETLDAHGDTAEVKQVIAALMAEIEERDPNAAKELQKKVAPKNTIPTGGAAANS